MSQLIASRIAVLCLGSAMLVAPVLAQEETAESRAEKVRNALIDRALSAPARVSSSAWLDESGQLRHVTRIYSEMRTRAAADFAEQSSSTPAEVNPPEQPAVRPGQGSTSSTTTPTPAQKSAAAPTRPAGGAASGTVPAAVSSTASAATSVSNEVASCHGPSRGLKRMAELQLHIQPWDGSRGYAMMADFEQQLRRTLIQLAASGDFGIAPPPGRVLGSYEQLLTRQGVQDAPYRIEVAMVVSFPQPSANTNPQGSDRPATTTVAEVSSPNTSPGSDDARWARWSGQRDLTLPARDFELSMGLRELATGRMVTLHRVPIRLPGRPSLVGTPELPDSVRQSIAMATLTWWSQTQAALSCQPLQVLARGDVDAGRVLIPVGAAAGVRVGDRWVLEDRARVPGRVLEEGALERARVAEVTAVSAHRAVLKLSQNEQAAAAAGERGVPWFATPM